MKRYNLKAGQFVKTFFDGKLTIARVVRAGKAGQPVKLIVSNAPLNSGNTSIERKITEIYPVDGNTAA